jgi:hypothetical protein
MYPLEAGSGEKDFHALLCDFILTNGELDLRDTKWTSDKETRDLMLGLDPAGKPTILYWLDFGDQILDLDIQALWAGVRR